MRRSLVAAAVLVFTGAAVLVAAELGIRLGIAMGWEPLRDPGLYAGWHDDELFWKLRYHWRAGTPIHEAGFVSDPDLGWIPSRPTAASTSAKSSIVFYGDSFMQGVAPTAETERIPNQVERLLAAGARDPGRPSPSVVDLAVAGYGVDQIYLRFHKTHADFVEPSFVLGLLTLDLDRALFAVRDAPKPRFLLRQGELVLSNVPIPEDPAVWHAQHPIEVRSYLGAAISRRWRLTRDSVGETEIRYRREEKKRLAGRVLETLTKEARASRRPFVFVVFYGEWELHMEGWREVFLREFFEGKSVDFIDTKAVLLAAMADTGQSSSHFYYPVPNGHPNPKGNQVIASAIVEHLRRPTSPE